MKATPQQHLSAPLSRYLQKYEYAIGFRRRDWAWEFLRRNQRFQAEAYAGQGRVEIKDSCVPNSRLFKLTAPDLDAEAWGLLFFPNPDQPAPRAHVFWDPALDPLHVTVHVLPREPSEEDALYEKTLARCSIDHLTDANGTEHLLARGAFGTAQSKCSGLSLLTSNQATQVSLNMQGPDGVDRSYLAYKRAESVLSPGPHHWTERTLRMRNALICLDVKDAGLDLRHAAKIIYGEKRVAEDWTRSKSFRDQVRGFYRSGKIQRSGGYRRLLGAKEAPQIEPH